MEPSGRDRWQPMADALALETIRNGCYPDRPAPCTMNLQEFIVATSHRL
jgi:hypothetical protein